MLLRARQQHILGDWLFELTVGVEKVNVICLLYTSIYGFQNILLNLLAAHKPDAVAIAWDERAPTFRHTAYDGYKATRHGMPEELAQQMPVLKELLTDLGFVQVSKAGWEADDILGTLAAASEAAGGTTLLATGDRDSLQLVDDATTVLLATNKETIPMDPAAIREKYGIEPPQLIDVKSLMGDASDNIPCLLYTSRCV